MLAAAWRRTDAARKFVTADHASAYHADAAAAVGDVELGKASTANAGIGSALSISPSSPCALDAAAATMLDIDAQQEGQMSVRRVSRSCIRASATVQLQQALTNMLQVGGGAHNWVLTWPSGMEEFNVDQLLLMQKHAALHRSRNARPITPKPISHAATLQSESESS